MGVLALLVLAFDSAQAASCSRQELSGLLVDVSVESTAASALVGDDEDIPIGCDIRIAVSPPIDDDGLERTPNKIEEAFSLMLDSLPKWYVNALWWSSDEHECAVSLNGVDVSANVNAWFWVRWKLGDAASAIRQQLTALGIPDDRDMRIARTALSFGFCEFVKSQDLERAMAVVTSYQSARN